MLKFNTVNIFNLKMFVSRNIPTQIFTGLARTLSHLLCIPKKLISSPKGFYNDLYCYIF